MKNKNQTTPFPPLRIKNRSKFFTNDTEKIEKLIFFWKKRMPFPLSTVKKLIKIYKNKKNEKQFPPPPPPHNPPSPPSRF